MSHLHILIALCSASLPAVMVDIVAVVVIFARKLHFTRAREGAQFWPHYASLCVMQ